MPGTATEKPDSRTVNSKSATIGYTITTDDQSEVTAWTALAAAAPSTFNSQDLDTLGLSPTENRDLWGGIANYKPHERKQKEPPATGEADWSFSTQGATKHITNSIATSNSYGASPPDYKQLIGAREDGVDGVDIVVPSFNFTQKFYVLKANFTAAYMGHLYKATGKTNDDTFLPEFEGVAVSFSAGEVLFNGANCSSRVDDVEVVASFSALPNETGLGIGGIAAIAKEGWEHLWIHFEEKDDATAKRLVKRPLAVYVEQVYGEYDFDLIVPSGY